MDGIERKAVSLELDEVNEGSFIVRIATLDVIDKDGDETKPGAFKDNGAVLVSSYQHGSWMGSLPVGKATIKEDGKDIFVHATGLIDPISNNDEVHFEIGQGRDGRDIAEQVKVLYTSND